MKKRKNILPSNVATVQICSVHIHVSVLKLAQAKHVMTAFNSKGKHKKLAIVGTRSPKYTELCHFMLLYVLQKTAKKCTKIQNAHAEPLFCLFVDVLVAVAIVVC